MKTVSQFFRNCFSDFFAKFILAALPHDDEDPQSGEFSLGGRKNRARKQPLFGTKKQLTHPSQLWVQRLKPRQISKNHFSIFNQGRGQFQADEEG
jgi:hypothetical protein